MHKLEYQFLEHSKATAIREQEQHSCIFKDLTGVSMHQIDKEIWSSEKRLKHMPPKNYRHDEAETFRRGKPTALFLKKQQKAKTINLA